MDDFRTGELTGDLKEVPGIGPAAVKLLAEQDITNTYHLIGAYMRMANVTGVNGEQSIDTYQLNQDFWYYLKNLKISSHRSAIVLAISEKVGSSFPAFHDANIYDDE